jgi:uncharacterized protein involved in outer membrane biogenesis
MSKPWKLTLYAAGAVLATALLVAVIALLAWRGHAKPQLEAAASDALGMEVKIGGPLVLKFFPGLGMTLKDVRIRSRGTEFATASEATLGIELVSLLRRQVRIPTMAFRHVTISVERGRDGKLNFGGAGSAALPTIDSTEVLLTDLTFSYTNRLQGTGVHAGPCNVEARQLRVSESKGGELMKNLSLSATVSCEQIKTRDLPMSDVKFSAESGKGVLEAKKITLHSFGGQGVADVRAEFSGAVPAIHVHGVLSKFRLEEFSRNFSQNKVGEGLMDFSTDLSMTGRDADEMTRTSSGEASLHGSGITLDVGDLDEKLSNYKATQRFNLVDLGAFLLAGPIGLAVTKGYDYSKVVGSSAGSSQVQAFISEWHVERGVAQAKDVAMSTKANRLALKGNLDFVNGSFQDVTIAVLNRRGCVTVEQKVHGSFGHPDVEKPNVVTSLAGPAVHLLKKAERLLGAEPHCEVWYSGALPAPG